MPRPRVTTRREIAPVEFQRLTADSHTTPRVCVEVEFDLHDHHAALAELDRAVAIVKAQIEETHRE